MIFTFNINASSIGSGALHYTKNPTFPSYHCLSTCHMDRGVGRYILDCVGR